MSTPQDDPNGQGNRQGEGQPWSAPGTGGTGQGGHVRPGAYGQGDGGGRYDYQSAQQPSSYAYPTPPAGGSGPADKGPAPAEVQRAYYLILAAGILYLVASVVSGLTTPVPDAPGASIGVGLGIVFAALFTAVYIVLAVFIRKGHNWARITATVLAGLNVLSVLSSFLLLPLVGQAAEATGQAAVQPSGLSLALSVIVMLLGVAGVVLTYAKPARPYFAPRKLGY
ncbi:hypothetical protein ACX80U_02670 [Arthrobacter sp. TmT3-37]|uniref:Uncharacterized protein n=1 Tax=Arthrobacter agilis TaxID=37921 RepID=A0A2L0UFG0_9MICC|nr:hypothetical protein [Arthrobacter agilis]AUZ87962.1 hypothetical protein CVO76_10245 [Arthrobacter agilis]